MKDNEIIFLSPVFTNNIWGGTRLRNDFSYAVEGDHVGESWGIAAHENGDCTVKEGTFSGMRLSVLYREHPELFGEGTGYRFPFLTKFIDAAEDLSIQVHPDDGYAKIHENGSPGKRECWYVMDCPDNASLVIGHNARTHEEMKSMIMGGRWSEFLRKVPVKKGSFLQIEPGTVHAITAGCLICEVQQNSDITYRLYDYDRIFNGRPRELHLSKSMDVISVPAKSMENSVLDVQDLPLNNFNLIESNKYFNVFFLHVNGKMGFLQKYPFMGMTVVEGTGYINDRHIVKGDNFILPNSIGDCMIDGDLTIIAATI